MAGFIKNQNTAVRALNDLGLAAWFGGSLMGAIGLNGAAAEVDHPRERVKVANAGWSRWTPANLAAIGAYTVGSLVLTGANRGRLSGQRGVGSTALVKTGLTAAAMAATAYSRVLGQTLMKASDPPADGATEPSAATEPEVADAQRKLKVMQWVIPLLTGATLVLNSKMGEQQRPSEVTKGVLGRLNPAA
ncbi:MAG: hypothetical protein M3N37_00200 [Actinomycetota bacterium]|nr:hypothetical protein [Actinomycetota bacterium]MDP8953349.1 hypothetical protein [Actinomycetota bacterium]